VAIPGIVYVVYNFIVEFLNMRHLSLLNYLYSCVTFVGNTSYLLKSNGRDDYNKRYNYFGEKFSC